jgi:hypothetical protein
MHIWLCLSHGKFERNETQEFLQKKGSNRDNAHSQNQGVLREKKRFEISCHESRLLLIYLAFAFAKAWFARPLKTPS